MNKRDTIIIAVLINAGILLILFATALPSKDDRELEKGDKAAFEQAVQAVAQEEKPATETILPLTPADEVDLVLSEWNIKPGERIETNADTITYQALPQIKEESVLVSSTVNEVKEEKPALVAIHTDSKPAVKADNVQVVVKKGDSLDKIARAHGTNVEELKSLNSLSSGVLQIGQVLKVPQKNTKIASNSAKTSSKKPIDSNQKTAAQAKSTPKYYTVKSGDSPWLIANKHNVKLEELLKLNNLNEEKARKLKPGDKIRIS